MLGCVNGFMLACEVHGELLKGGELQVACGAGVCVFGCGCGVVFWLDVDVGIGELFVK